MQITVDKTEALNDVMRESEYIGAKYNDYENIRIKMSDEELIRHWISDACLNIENELKELGGAGVAAGSAWVFQTTNVNGRDTWGSAAAQGYVENRALSEWLLLVNKKEQAEFYITKAGEKMAELKKLAYYRTPNV